MKLIPMTDFVLDVVQTPNINEAICWEQTQERLDKIYQYSLFLKQPLKLEMFVPCDIKGNVLNEPTDQYNSPQYYEAEMDECLSAKEKVLFEGFNTCICNVEIAVRKENRMPLLLSEMENMTIEDLVKGNLILTHSAVKKLQLKTES